MSKATRPIRDAVENIDPSAFTTRTITFHGEPACYSRTTAIRPADRREMVSSLPQLAGGRPMARPWAARTMAVYARELARHDLAEARFAEAAKVPGRRTESGMSLMAERLERDYSRRIDVLAVAARRALRALGISENRGAVRSGGRLFSIHRGPDDRRASVVVVDLEQLVELD